TEGNEMSQHELVLELELDAPAEKLYRCYTDAKLLQQWFAPKPWTIKSTDTDFRPGGRFNFVMASPEGGNIRTAASSSRSNPTSASSPRMRSTRRRSNPPARS